jgi:hypothetical protein
MTRNGGTRRRRVAWTFREVCGLEIARCIKRIKATNIIEIVIVEGKEVTVGVIIGVEMERTVKKKPKIVIVDLGTMSESAHSFLRTYLGASPIKAYGRTSDQTLGREILTTCPSPRLMSPRADFA